MKVKKLLHRLGGDGFTSLVWLWLYAAENAPDGRLEGLEGEDLEIAAGWTGDAGRLVETLEDLELLDRGGDCYVIHDWEDHQPWVVNAEKRSRKARKAALARWVGGKNATSTEKQCSEHKDSMLGASKTDAPSPSPSPSPSQKKESSLRSDSSPELPLAGAGEQPSPQGQKAGKSNTRDSGSEDPPSPVVLSVPLTKRDGEYQITQAQVDSWQEDFPGIDVMGELRKLRQWNLANERNRKTKSGIKRHVVGWLSRSQNSTRPTAPVEQRAAAAWEKRL